MAHHTLGHALEQVSTPTCGRLDATMLLCQYHALRKAAAPKWNDEVWRGHV